MKTLVCLLDSATCNAGILNGLQSSNWKERLTSMEALQQQVQDRKENLEGTNSILIQGMSYLPGWSEKNFQVIYRHQALAELATCSYLTMCECSAYPCIETG